jgi:hypothetical protein
MAVEQVVREKEISLIVSISVGIMWKYRIHISTLARTKGPNLGVVMGLKF